MVVRIVLASLILVSTAHAQDPHSNAAAIKEIELANQRLARDGAKFGPLHIKVTTDLKDVWHGFPRDKDEAISKGGVIFYRVNGEAKVEQGKVVDHDPTEVFLPLGDTAIVPSSSNAKYERSFQIPFGGATWPQDYANRIGALLFKADKQKSWALTHPTRFVWKGDDAGSGNSRNLCFWEPIPPKDYVALGWCFTNGPAPDTKKYWVVHHDLVVSALTQNYFNDKTYRFEHHALDLYEVIFKPETTHRDDELLLIPPTYLGRGGVPYALKLEKAFLDFDPRESEAQWWVGLKSPRVGHTTAPMLRKIAILPYCAVSDLTSREQAESSPWYFIVSEPYWKNLKNVTGDTTETLKVAYGVERSKAKSFREKTGVSTTDEEETNRNVEASGGKKDVWSIGGEYSKTTKQSSTYTTEFETFESTTDTEKTGTETTITVSFPRLPAGAVQWSYWQEFVKIVCYGYNSNGEVKVFGDILDYGNDDRVRLQIKTDGSLDTEGHK